MATQKGEKALRHQKRSAILGFMRNDKNNSNISSNVESNKVFSRNWLVKNEIYFTTITACLLSIMAIITSIVQINIEKKQSKIAETQLILNSDPVIILEPSTWIQGKDDVFNLNVKNIGLSDIYDIEVYENLFKSLSNVNMANAFSVDFATSLPTHKFRELQKKQIRVLTLDIASRLRVGNKGGKEELYVFYRLRIDYKRKPDGKRFSSVTVFLLAPHNNLWNIKNEALSLVPQVKFAREMLLGEI